MGSGGRSLVLLCCSTLLLISASAVSGDEHFRNFRRFGRLEREHLRHRAFDDAEVLKADNLDEKKPAEGIVEKARSFLSRFTTPIRNAVLPDHLASPFEKKRQLARHQEAEKSDVRSKFFRHKRGFSHSHSHWPEVRDLIRNHPERVAAVGVSATDSVALNEDVTADLEFQTKLRNIVGTGVGEYLNAGGITDDDATCAGALEEQVRMLVMTVRSALRGQLCNGNVVSTEERRLCNLFNDHPMMASLEVFAKIGVNPVLVPMRLVAATAACSSGNPFTDYMDSLKEMEGLAVQALLSPDLKYTEDTYMENTRKGYNRDRYPLGRHERHWWQRMFPMNWHHHFLEEREKGHWHEWHHELDHEDKDHEKHWLRRMFPLFQRHRHIWHYGPHHGHLMPSKDCFSRSLKHLVKGVKNQLFTTCHSASAPNVVSACKFAKEHRFLVKAWLAVQIPLWSEASKSCSSEDKIQVAPDTGLLHDRLAHLQKRPGREAEDSKLNPSVHRMEVFPRNPPWIPDWIERDCAGKFANRPISKALHLRGHLVGLSSTNDGNGLPGLAQTHLVVLREHRLHLHVTPELVNIAQRLDQFSSGEMFSDSQNRFHEVVGKALNDAASSKHQIVTAMTEKALFKPFDHHRRSSVWTPVKYRGSANPRVVPTSEGLHFRISANPRPVLDSSDEIPTEFVQESQILPP